MSWHNSCRSALYILVFLFVIGVNLRVLKRFESGQVGWNCFMFWSCLWFRDVLTYFGGSIIFASIIYFTEKLSCSQLSSFWLLLPGVLLLVIGSARTVALGGLKAWHECLHFCVTQYATQFYAILPPCYTDEKQNLRSWLYEYELDSAKSLDFGELTREHLEHCSWWPVLFEVSKLQWRRGHSLTFCCGLWVWKPPCSRFLKIANAHHPMKLKKMRSVMRTLMAFQKALVLVAETWAQVASKS